MLVTIDLTRQAGKWYVSLKPKGGFELVEKVVEPFAGRVQIDVQGGEVLVKERKDGYCVYIADPKRGLRVVGTMSLAAMTECIENLGFDPSNILSAGKNTVTPLQQVYPLPKSVEEAEVVAVAETEAVSASVDNLISSVEEALK